MFPTKRRCSVIIHCHRLCIVGVFETNRRFAARARKSVGTQSSISLANMLASSSFHETVDCIVLILGPYMNLLVAEEADLLRSSMMCVTVARLDHRLLKIFVARLLTHSSLRSYLLLPGMAVSFSSLQTDSRKVSASICLLSSYHSHGKCWYASACVIVYVLEKQVESGEPSSLPRLRTSGEDFASCTRD